MKNKILHIINEKKINAIVVLNKNNKTTEIIGTILDTDKPLYNMCFYDIESINNLIYYMEDETIPARWIQGDNACIIFNFNQDIILVAFYFNNIKGIDSFDFSNEIYQSFMNI